jgi:hypothetical protein
MSSVRSMCGGVAVVCVALASAASAAAVCVARTIFSTRTRSERLIRLGAFACVALLAPLHASGDLIFYNGNPYGVSNGGAPPQFTITSEYLITNIVDYHWNYGQGTATPGTISLARSGGTTYGPWQTTGLPGMYGVPNAYWSYDPNQIISPGTYTIIDSSPSTWSQNSASQGLGISWVYGEVTPEPATMSLLAMGGLALVARRRGRK